MAVFILEDALSVQTDNASVVVFILRTHYPTGRTWANIVVHLVMRLKYKDGHETHYASGRTFLRNTS